MVKASCTTVVKFVKKPLMRIMYPAGIWDVNTTYVGTEQKAPYVYYEPGDTYYGLNINAEVKGVNPAADYAEHGKNASWIPFENFQALFAKFMIVNFGLLGSAVFWGDYMFSQQGVDANGNETSNYKDFDGMVTDAFTPNFCINFRTGKLYALSAKLIGEIRATRGSIGGFAIGKDYIGSNNIEVMNTYNLRMSYNEFIMKYHRLQSIDFHQYSGVISTSIKPGGILISTTGEISTDYDSLYVRSGNTVFSVGRLGIRKSSDGGATWTSL